MPCESSTLFVVSGYPHVFLPHRNASLNGCIRTGYFGWAKGGEVFTSALLIVRFRYYKKKHNTFGEMTAMGAAYII